MIKLFRNIRLAHRLLFISVAFSAPIAVLLFLMVQGINGHIHFARWETYGNEYQRPLMALLLQLPQHQLAVQSGEKTAQAAAAGRVDQAFAQLESVHARLGEHLGFTAAELAKRKRDHVQLATVLREWADLKAAAGLPPATSAERHAHLIADIRMQITHAGDLSNLILDPDLDSFYLADATLSALPQLQDRLGATMALGAAVLSRPAVTADERVQFAVAAAMLKEADLDRALGSVDTALNEDANFHGVSPTLAGAVRPSAAAASAVVGEFITLTQTLAAEGKAKGDLAAYLAAGHRAREATQALWTAASGELDQLLAARIRVFEAQRNRKIGITGFVLAGSLGLVTLISLSLTGPLRSMIGTLDVNASQVAHAVGEWANSSQALAAGAGEQAASLEETSAALEEVASMTKRTAANAQAAKDLGNHARIAAEDGAVQMQAMSQAMVEIKAASDNIAKIVRTIDEIAFQTNLLALNAAVEAARAGSAGMCFAVVADEVRNLAQRSALSAKETAAKIEDCVTKSERGVEISVRVNASLQGIVAKVRQMDDLITEIAVATTEQSQGITQINSAVTQVDQVTQMSAGTANEIAESADSLRSQSGIMGEAVRELRNLVDGTAAPKSAPAPVPHARPVAEPTNGHANGRAAAVPARVKKSVATRAAAASAGGIPMPDGRAEAGGFRDF